MLVAENGERDFGAENKWREGGAKRRGEEVRTQIRMVITPSSNTQLPAGTRSTSTKYRASPMYILRTTSGRESSGSSSV